MADKDGDFKLSVHELKNWIQAKINEHYTHSEDENHGKFRELDSNNDGLITWDEYVDHLEVPKETNREMLLMAAEYHGPPANATRTRSPYHKEIDEDSRTQEQVVAAQFIHHTHEKWETADENEDGSLTEKEFLYYHHPEHNRKTVQAGQHQDRQTDGRTDGQTDKWQVVRWSGRGRLVSRCRQ
jgi:hypothetical protein